MKRSLFTLSAATAALLVCGFARAQLQVGNNNDLQYNNGGDIIYYYDNPSIGSPMGVSGIPDYATNTYFWRTIPGAMLRHCSGTMELTGEDLTSCDGDYTAVDGSGNNTGIGDMNLSKAAATQSIPGVYDPDQLDAANLLVSFGPDTGKGNIFVTDPGCPPAGYINCFEFDIDLTNGGGVGTGFPLVANGVQALVETWFIGGGGQTYVGFPNSCADNNGDGVWNDLHSSGLFAGTVGETRFDTIGGGLSESPFGGFGSVGATLGADDNSEINANWLEFSNPVVSMNVNSKVSGAGFLEEGTAGFDYNCPPVLGGQMSARLYAAQGIGQKAGIFLTLTPPLATCLKFKGDKLGLSPTDPLFGPIGSLWTGTVTLTNNGAPLGTEPRAFDDGTFTALPLPLAAQQVPIGVSVPLAVQGFYKKPSGLVEGSQVTSIVLHG